MYDIIIIGGGAAGLACAALLSGRLNVLVAEAGDRAGKKLSATGNGQGNISNENISAANYHGGGAAVASDLLNRYGLADFKRIFGTMLYKKGAMGRIYPQSLQASSLTDILLKRLGGNVKLMLRSRVLSAEKSGGVFNVKCENGSYSGKILVLATGGKAQRQFNTDGSAYALAQSFWHSITPLYPSIVQLKCDTTHIKGLKGIRANCFVEAYVGGNLKNSVTADVIFTDYGLSGNAVFYLSSVLCEQGGTLKLDFLPEYSKEEIADMLRIRLDEGVDISDILCGVLHNRIAYAILKRAGGDIDKIAYIAKNFNIEVIAPLGFDYAQVTRGGIDMRDVDKNLRSKLCENLYFAGEILDIDGDCGGYNLHWAFVSALAVADDILKNYEKA